MSVEARIRELVAEGGGRAPIARVVKEALGVAGATGPLARRLAESAVKELRGLVLDGEHVVERAMPRATKQVALALAPVSSPTALPAIAAWLPLPEGGEPVVVPLAGERWREGVSMLARDLAGCDVFALSAASARRVLRLGANVANLEAGEPEVIPLGPVARKLGKPLRGPEDAAALVGANVPESAEDAARLLVRLCAELARIGSTDLDGLRALSEAEAPVEFDFGERAFGRDHLRALPEAPGVYVLEDAEGDVAYVGKAKDLRRRVATYFRSDADERAARVRDVAHGLSFERTGTELSALLREQQLIRELRPALNVQEDVHARGRQSALGGRLAIVQPSAEGGAEIVLLERDRGALACDVVPDADEAELLAVLRPRVEELGSRPRGGEDARDVEIALTWLADRGASASIVELPADPREACDLLIRLARDPDLAEGRIVPVR